MLGHILLLGSSVNKKVVHNTRLITVYYFICNEKKNINTIHFTKQN